MLQLRSKETLDHGDRGWLGLLRLNAPHSFGVRYVARLISAFNGRHPKVTVDLGLNDRVVDLIDEGWDLTIRVGRLKDSRLVSRKLAESAMLVCAAPGYWAGRGRPKLWTDLQYHNCLGSSISAVARPDEWLFGRDRDGRVAVTGTMRANNGNALVMAAMQVSEFYMSQSLLLPTRSGGANLRASRLTLLLRT